MTPAHFVSAIRALHADAVPRAVVLVEDRDFLDALVDALSSELADIATVDAKIGRLPFVIFKGSGRNFREPSVRILPVGGPLTGPVEAVLADASTIRAHKAGKWWKATLLPRFGKGRLVAVDAAAQPDART